MLSGRDMNRSSRHPIIRIINASPPYLLSLAAALCLGFAVYFICNDKLKAGALLSGLFFLCVLLAYFPQLESVKAFTVDVKLRRSLDRAEEILNHLKKLTIINAKTSYMILAWQNRWGGASAKEKQAILDDFDQMLIELNASDERDEIVRPYVQLIGVDLYAIFLKVIEKYVAWKKEHLEDSDAAKLQEMRVIFSTNESEWRLSTNESPYASRESYDLDFYLQRKIPRNLFNDKEQKIADKFRKEVLELYLQCKEKGGLTPEAAALLDERHEGGSGADNKMKEIFNLASSTSA